MIRAAFAWLVEVRYLAGNPWSAVHEPATVIRESAVQVHRALPADLWTRVRRLLDNRCTAPILPSSTEPREAGAHLSKQARARVEQEAAPQWRAARAAILLMGDSGLRRVEAAQARQEDLRPSDVRSESSTPARRPSEEAPATGEASASRPRTVWTLTIVGKRRKQRTVPVSGATLDALRAHWADRDRNLDSQAHGPLIAPLWIPETNTAQNRHATDDLDVAYTPDALGRLVRTAVRRLVVALRADPASLSEISTEDLVQLVNTSAHAFRHTFGTRAVARDMPTDAVQSILGHASLQTTSIYVKAEKRRMLEAAARYYADDDAQ
ncbi:tyrosine-type recombinase/integrase [Caballeronia sp. HLA56]